MKDAKDRQPAKIKRREREVQKVVGLMSQHEEHLRKIPHPVYRMADKGLSLYDYIGWFVENGKSMVTPNEMIDRFTQLNPADALEVMAEVQDERYTRECEAAEAKWFERRAYGPR